MYSVLRDNGKTCAIQTPDGVVPFGAKGNKDWEAFLDWNAKQPVPLDLSDKAPEPPKPDPDENMIQIMRSYLKDTTPATATAAQREAYVRAIGVLILRTIGRRDS